MSSTLAKYDDKQKAPKKLETQFRVINAVAVGVGSTTK